MEDFNTENQIEGADSLQYEEWEKPIPNIAVMADEYIENKAAEQRADLMLNDEHINVQTVEIARTSLKNAIEKQRINNDEAEIDNAEKEFDNDVRIIKLKHKKQQLDLQHKYDMNNIHKKEKHRQMLDNRVMLKEKYEHLYSENETFCYNKAINIIRSITNSLSKLNKTIKQVLKISFWVGIIIGGIFLIRYLGIW